MLPDHNLASDLEVAIEDLARQPFPQLLLQHGILRQTAQNLLLQRLRDSVTFSLDQQALLLPSLWDGVPVDPPANLEGDWIGVLPELIQGPLRQRWDQIRLQKWIEDNYQDGLDAYFLERRAELEQIVYGMIRLRNQGTAEEIYLRLLDDGADFGELAKVYSQGEERFTRGLVGPMLISQPHPTIRRVLEGLKMGDIHPPFQVDTWILLVRMEHRQPANLSDSTRQQLYNELFQKDLEASLDARLAELYPQLLATTDSAVA